jgi:hypothetical protein
MHNIISLKSLKNASKKKYGCNDVKRKSIMIIIYYNCVKRLLKILVTSPVVYKHFQLLWSSRVPYVELSRFWKFMLFLCTHCYFHASESFSKV